MISWLELNHLNASVKIATDALMLYIKSWKNVLKRIWSAGLTHKRLFHRRVLRKFSFQKTVVSRPFKQLTQCANKHSKIFFFFFIYNKLYQ